MAGSTGLNLTSTARRRENLEGSPLVPGVLIGITTLFFGVFILAPLALVFSEALRKGFDVYVAALTDSLALSAIQLTLTVSLVVVPLNTIFGLFAAWALTRYRFRGRTFVMSILDLPIAVSPVVAGLVFVLLLGTRTPLGAWFNDAGIKIIFSTPGIIIATLFVTFPLVARELIPLMQSLGTEIEEAALTLGASGWQIFRRITLPSIAWGLVYGMVLCNARAIGEFGAVSVVSGHVRGQTNTIPLHVEILYNDYQFAASFAAASILVFIALVTIGVKLFVERYYRKQALALAALADAGVPVVEGEKS